MSLFYSLCIPGCGLSTMAGIQRSEQHCLVGRMNRRGILAASLQTASGLHDALAKCMSRGICSTWQFCLETWLEELLSL